MINVPLDITGPHQLRPAPNGMEAPYVTRSPGAPPERVFYRAFNRELDRENVPYTVNESLIAGLRDRLVRKRSPQNACYWLLMARLAEMTLLCAGHYADCGEIRAAGDLMLNPRRIHVYMPGADNHVTKDRHRRLSRQFNPGDLPFPAFAVWFQRNAIVQTVEPALLPDFADRLDRSGWLSTTFRTSFRNRMSTVADAMRFGTTGSRPPGSGSGHSSLDGAVFRALGRDVEMTCCDPAYHSPYLTDHPGPGGGRIGHGGSHDLSSPGEGGDRLLNDNVNERDEGCHVDRTLYAG